MENDHLSEPNYWKILASASAALDQGDFATAEGLYHDAAGRRDQSPGRVFFSEKLTDGLKNLLSSSSKSKDSQQVSSGRWSQRTEEFRARFLARGEQVVREGVRVAGLRPEDDPVINQPVLETALFLVARSRLFQEEPSSAVPVLKGLFRTACRTGRPFDFHLVRHDLPLTEEDRLWLARKGGQLCDVFMEQGKLEPGSAEAGQWARVVLQLLQPGYFGSTSRLEEERSWLEAITADRLLRRAGDCVELYRAYLGVGSVSEARVDEARVRLLELLSNTDAEHFPVPRYEEALAVMNDGSLPADSVLAPRWKTAHDRIGFRRPKSTTADRPGWAWASLALGTDGRVTIVFWWNNQPRDLASWSPGEDLRPLEEFLAPCAGRLVAYDETVFPVVRSEWQVPVTPWPVRDFLVAVMESRLPQDGLDQDTLRGLCLAESGPWRTGWNSSAGHGELEPPSSSSLLETWDSGPVADALQAGLAWLAVRNRVTEGDPALCAGLGELARRGDGPSRFLYDFILMDSTRDHSLDEAFQAWTLPVLWTRPDPFGWTGTGVSARTEPPPATDQGIRLDLGRNDLAIVSTGDPAAVMAAWGDGRQKLRVVLDRLDRLDTLANVAPGVIGPVTLIPQAGTVHCLDEALSFLESLLTADRGQHDAMLPIFHWQRLVETHNGDLLDFRQVRPRPSGQFPLYERYAVAIAGIDREEPRLEPDRYLDTWSGQFSQRVRKAGLVAGPVDHMAVTPEKLDSLWGVFEGSDASWVFLDSAAIHWSLWQDDRVNIQDIHALMHSRGNRHLSLLTGAVWLRAELESLLGTWLGIFGNPYCLSLTDGRPPALRLADRGVQPDALIQASEALASQATWMDRAFDPVEGGYIQMPVAGRAAEFWAAVSQGDMALAGTNWNFIPGAGEKSPVVPVGGGVLAVPTLDSLEGGPLPRVRSDTRADWARADAERGALFALRRKVCSLEIAAHLAGPWETVVILDTRWWRPLVAESRSALKVSDSRSTPGQTAVMWATEGAGRVFDLPGSEPDGRHPVDGRILSLVEGWLGTRSVPDTQIEAAADLAASQGVALAERGVRLLVGDESSAWRDIVRRLAEAWERGRVDEWVLLVTDEVPTGASDLVASAGLAGFSVWQGQPEREISSPVVWVEPEDFGDPRLTAFLDSHPPDVVVAGDVADWRPGLDREAQETAFALRSILDSGAASILLYCRQLEDSWTRFLVAACGAELVTAAKDDSRPPTPPPQPVSELPCLDCGAARDGTLVVGRLRALLPRLRELLLPWGHPGDDPPSSAAPAPGHRLMSCTWLGHLAGIPAAELSEGVRLLRWAGRLAGDSLSVAGSQQPGDARPGQGHSLLIARRFADLENTLEQLERNLGVMLPLWLSGVRPGILNWVDLENPPARIDEDQLTLLDCFLIWNGLEDSTDLDGVEDSSCELVYLCPRGMLHSNQRLLGCRGPSGEVLRELVRRLGVFRSRIEEVMEGALETGQGFLVETGLTQLRSEEQSFLGLGAALGFWSWNGPPCPGAIHLVDLLTLAESRTLHDRADGWELVRAEAATRYPGTGSWGTAAGTLEPTTAQAGRGLRSLRSLLAGGAEKRDDLDTVVSRVGDLVKGTDDSSLLVLKGVFGSGRHEALGRGLWQGGLGTRNLPEITIYCPDEGVAAMVCRQFLQLGLTGPLDIRVPQTDESRAEVQTSKTNWADPMAALVIMCEAQRFDSETRYRIAQTGRGRRLLMTVDPVASVEPWEHLFLTTPRTRDIVDLPGQRRAAKKLWSEIRRLVPPEYQGGGIQRRDKGILISDYAANLDQCLSRVVHEHQAGKLRSPLRVTAPMPGDLEYLGSSMRNLGWLAVLEARLESFLLPGPREFLAAATDQLVLGGHLKEAALEANLDETRGAVAADEPEQPDLLLPRLLGPEAGAAWQQWVSQQDISGDITLNDFAERLAPTSWANTFLAHAAARERIGRLLGFCGGESLLSLMGIPLWEAWWYSMVDDLAVTGPKYRRPLAALTSAARPLGGSLPGAAYLCLGTEPLRQHYESLVRVTDSLLVLYQEKSPLPSEAPD